MEEKNKTVEEIRKKLKSGYPQGELKNEYARKGFSAEDIEILFNQASRIKNEASKRRYYSENKVAGWMLAGSCLLITGIAISGTGIWPGEYAPYVLIAGAGFIVVALAIRARNE